MDILLAETESETDTGIEAAGGGGDDQPRSATIRSGPEAAAATTRTETSGTITETDEIAVDRAAKGEDIPAESISSVCVATTAIGPGEVRTAGDTAKATAAATRVERDVVVEPPSPMILIIKEMDCQSKDERTYDGAHENSKVREYHRKEVSMYVKQDDTKIKLQEGKHYERYGNMWVSIPGGFRYNIDRIRLIKRVPMERSPRMEPGKGNANEHAPEEVTIKVEEYTYGELQQTMEQKRHRKEVLLPLMISRTPPYFIWGLEAGWPHYALPIGPLFYPCDTFSVSLYQGKGEDVFLEALGQVYRADRPENNDYAKSYALLLAMQHLPDKGNRIRSQWLKEWKSGEEIKSNYYGSRHRRQALVLHAIGAYGIIEPIRRSRMPSLFETLTIARWNAKAGWGDWFIKCDPEPSKYQVTMSYDEKRRHILIDFYAPTFKGKRVVVRVTEFGGTVTDHVMEVKNPKSTNRWIIELVEEKGEGRGGRKPSAQERKKKSWLGAHGIDDQLELMSRVGTRKFWAPTPVRHVQIDPCHQSLLLCSSIDAPITWAYEILDEARFAPDKVPVDAQEAYIECLRMHMADDNHVTAFLITVICTDSFKVETRAAAFAVIAKEGWTSTRSAWQRYKRTMRPEAEIAHVVITCGLTGPEDNESKLELLVEMMCLSGDHPFYETIRDPLLNAIDAIEWKNHHKRYKGLKSEESELGCFEDEHYQYELQRWARVERMADRLASHMQSQAESRTGPKSVIKQKSVVKNVHRKEVKSKPTMNTATKPKGKGKATGQKSIKVNTKHAQSKKRKKA